MHNPSPPRNFPSRPYAKHDIYSNLPKPASLNERYPAPVCHSVPPSRDPPSCSPPSVITLPAAWSPGFSNDKACEHSMHIRAPANANHFFQHHQESCTPWHVHWQKNGATRVREHPQSFKYDKQTYGPPPVQMPHFNFDVNHQQKKISSSAPGPLITKKDSVDMPQGTKRKQCQIDSPEKKDESGKLGRVTKNDVDATNNMIDHEIINRVDLRTKYGFSRDTMVALSCCRLLFLGVGRTMNIVSLLRN